MAEATSKPISVPQTAGDNPEQRRAPRVVAGRPARFLFARGENAGSIRCGVIDISASGCRLLFNRSELPKDFHFDHGAQGVLQIRLEAEGECALPVEVVWSQANRDNFRTVGVKFAEEAAAAMRDVTEFIMARLHAGLQITQAAPVAQGKSEPLRVPLELEGRPRGDADAPPYRFSLLAVGGGKAEAVLAPKQGEKELAPQAGEVLDASVFPPQWARGANRALCFAARVREIAGKKVVLDIFVESGDLYQMIRNLVPPEVVRQQKPLQIDVRTILLVLALIILALLIASMRPSGF